MSRPGNQIQLGDSRQNEANRFLNQLERDSSIEVGYMDHYFPTDPSTPEATPNRDASPSRPVYRSLSAQRSQSRPRSRSPRSDSKSPLHNSQRPNAYGHASRSEQHSVRDRSLRASAPCRGSIYTIVVKYARTGFDPNELAEALSVYGTLEAIGILPLRPGGVKTVFARFREPLSSMYLRHATKTYFMFVWMPSGNVHVYLADRDYCVSDHPLLFTITTQKSIVPVHIVSS